MDTLRIVVLEGDETGQELLEQSLRVLDPDVLGIELVLERHDLSLGNRRATKNGVVHPTAKAICRSPPPDLGLPDDDRNWRRIGGFLSHQLPNDGSPVVLRTAARGAKTLVLAGLCLIWTAPPLASATFPGRSGEIVYATGNQLRAMQPDGSHDHLILRMDNVQAPDVSADGRRVVFLGGNDFDIYIVSIDGSDLFQLTRGFAMEYAPAFSPDGRHIAFTGYEGMSIMRDDGGGVHRIETGNGISGQPAWSPDGRTIAFAHRPRGARGTSIWTIHPNGSGMRRLSQYGLGQRSPDFSPDGRKVVFSGGERLFTVRIDGTHQHKLPAQQPLSLPAFSPDGKTIAARGCCAGRRLIFMNADGSHKRSVVPSGGGAAYGFSWQPLQPARRASK